jgi:hypothetical protein
VGGKGKDEIVTHVQRYSDALLIQLLKGRNPSRYRERMQVESSGTLTHDHRVDVDLSKLPREKRQLLRELLQSDGGDEPSS